MTFPVVAATALSWDTSQDTNYNVTLPASNAGDLLIILLSYFGGRPNPASFAGWTALAAGVGDGAWCIDCYARIATGSEGTNVTGTGASNAQNSAIAYRITGHAGTIPEAISSFLGSTPTPDPLALSPSWGAKDTLWLAMLGRDDNGSNLNTFPASYTNTQNAGGHGIHGCYSAERARNIATEDPGAYGGTGANRNSVVTVAIRPPDLRSFVGEPGGAVW